MNLPETREELIKLVNQLRSDNEKLRQRVKELEEILKRRKIKPPPTIKPSVNSGTKNQGTESRKQRDTAHVRKKSSEPEFTIYHAMEEAPDCQVTIGGGLIFLRLRISSN